MIGPRDGENHGKIARCRKQPLCRDVDFVVNGGADFIWFLFINVRFYVFFIGEFFLGFSIGPLYRRPSAMLNLYARCANPEQKIDLKKCRDEIDGSSSTVDRKVCGETRPDPSLCLCATTSYSAVSPDDSQCRFQSSIIAQGRRESLFFF